MVNALTYLTEDLPGIGGTIKQRPEDFFVEEQPLYEPAGTGEHLYLFTEKRGLTTSDLVRRTAKACRVGRSDVGYAGLKDKHAITRQLVSVALPKSDPDSDRDLLDRLAHSSVKVLWARRHANKLRRGHLRGNRFVIRIRNVGPDALAPAKRTLDSLTKTGVPNYIGEQRFGYRGINHQLGRLLLLGQWQDLLDQMLGQPCPEDRQILRDARTAYERGDYAAALDAWPRPLRHDRQALDALRQGKSAQQAVMTIDRAQRDLLVSALQSAVFNRVLDQRIQAGLLGCLLEGDLAWKHDNRAVFLVDRAAAETDNAPDARVDRLEVSPSGPMWGVAMPMPGEGIAQIERDALAEQNIDPAHLAGGTQASASGARRPMRAILTDASAKSGDDEHGPYLQIEFTLPRGCFATMALREIMKPDESAPTTTTQYTPVTAAAG